jgi:hypothetical protein
MLENLQRIWNPVVLLCRIYNLRIYEIFSKCCYTPAPVETFSTYLDFRPRDTCQDLPDSHPNCVKSLGASVVILLLKYLPLNTTFSQSPTPPPQQNFPKKNPLRPLCPHFQLLCIFKPFLDFRLLWFHYLPKNLKRI